MSFNNPFKPPDKDPFNPFSSGSGKDDKPGEIPSSFTTPSTQGRQNPDGKGPHSPMLRNPLDPPGFGTKESLDPAYKNPFDNFSSPADGLYSGKSQDPFKTGGKK